MKKLIISIVFIISGITLPAQPHLKQFRFSDPYVKSVSFDFEMVSNLIIIPLSINNSPPLKMIFDSGVKTAILTELHTSDTISFKYSRVQVLQGLGEGRSIMAYPSYGNKIELEGIKGIQQDLYILGQNDINFSTRLGIPINGLIGHDLIKDFIVEINYVDKRLILHDPEKFSYKNDRRAESFPLDIVDGKPFITGSIIQENGDTIETRLLIDTGGGFALWLSTESDTSIILPENGVRTYLGYGLGGEISGSIARLQTAMIGPFAFEMPVVAYPDSGSVSSVIIDDARNGSIGAELLRRFDIILDYPGKRITLRPNSSYYEDFTFNRSGIELVAPVPSLKAYFVSRVQPGSAAELAGLKVNDQILQVNLRLASECDMNDLNAYFHGKHGQKLKIKLLRNGVKMTIKFPLEETLLPE